MERPQLSSFHSARALMHHALRLALAMLVTGGQPLAAQPPVFRGAVVGTLRDSSTQAPLDRAVVCVVLDTDRPAYKQMRCAGTDSGGAYRLDRLPVGVHQLSAGCQAVSPQLKHLGVATVVVDSADVRQDWVLDARGCDVRVVRRIAGVFAGHYTGGFESSEFVPCAADAWFLPSDSLRREPVDERRAWVTWPDDSGRTMRRVRWPAVPHDGWGSPRFFVRWRGTVIGPGHYGHLGMFPFVFRVDSVLAVRAPRKSDCRPA